MANQRTLKLKCFNCRSKHHVSICTPRHQKYQKTSANVLQTEDLSVNINNLSVLLQTATATVSDTAE